MIKSSLFFIVLLTFSLFINEFSCISLKSGITKKSKLSLRQENKTGIVVTVDNYLIDVKINHVSLDLSKLTDLNNWQRADNFSFDIKEGDRIDITGINQGPYSLGNPAAIIAEVHYLGKDGNVYVLPTNSDWYCDSLPAKDLGAYGTGAWGSNVFNHNFQLSHWIWSEDVATSNNVTCSVVIGEKGPLSPPTSDC